jgi:hypothetical protein
MAMTLAELAGGMTEGSGTYRDYQIACMEMGKTPLPHAEWVKAGKPSK